MAPRKSTRVLTKEEVVIRRKVQRGIKDFEEGKYETYDAAGLMQLAKDIVANSMRKIARRKKALAKPA